MSGEQPAEGPDEGELTAGEEEQEQIAGSPINVPFQGTKCG
jgi:hypothetical protein